VSLVHGVILKTFLRDSGVEEINRYLTQEHKAPLVKVSQHAGGNKALEHHLWIGAFNWLDIEALIEVFRRVKWCYPDLVQLFVKHEHDDYYITHTCEEVEGTK
jgi:hypothetical protein